MTALLSISNTFFLVPGACLSQRSFFAQPFKQELNAYRYGNFVSRCMCLILRMPRLMYFNMFYRWRMSWSYSSDSDCLALLNAYKVSLCFYSSKYAPC